MSDTDNQSRPRPIPHVRLYVGAGALFAMSAFAIAVIIFDSAVTGMPSAAAACAVMATLIIVGAASMKRHERCDERTSAQLDRIEDAQERMAQRLESIAVDAKDRAEASFASGYLEGVHAHRRAVNGSAPPQPERPLYIVPNGD